MLKSKWAIILFSVLWASICNGQTIGRYVHISISGKNKTLSLAEVQVYKNGTNIALKKPTKQNSTGYGGLSSRAVDGNTSDDWGKGPITQTAGNTEYSAWEVDLGNEAKIDNIKINNRKGFEKRINGVEILILDQSRKSVWGEKRVDASSSEITLDTMKPGNYQDLGKIIPEIKTTAGNHPNSKLNQRQTIEKVNALPYGSLLYFIGEKSKQYGFLVKNGDSYYAYTSQSGLLYTGQFKLQSMTGNPIVITGKLELSYFNDVVRIKVDPGKLKDQYFELGSRLKMGEKVEACLEDISSRSSANIKGVGMYAFALDKSNPNDLAGTPVCGSDGRAIGVLSRGYNAFKINSDWDDGKVKLSEIKNKIAARLDVEIIWTNADDVQFFKTAELISRYCLLQSEFLPLLNWWCTNPYRQIGDNIKYPKSLERWVKNHNNRTKAYDYTIKRCAENPIGRKGLIKSLIDANLQRGLVLSKFAQGALRQMQINKKTTYLNYYSGIYMREWAQIDDLMESRQKNMEFMLPHEFEQIKLKSNQGNQKSKNYSNNWKNNQWKKTRASYAPFDKVSNSFVIMEAKNGKKYLAAAVKIGEDGYVVTSQSIYMEGVTKFNLNTFHGKNLNQIDFEVNAEEDLVRIKLEKSPDITLLPLAKNTSENKTAYKIDPYDGIIYQETADNNNLLNKNFKCTTGSPIINSKGEFVGVASRTDDEFGAMELKTASFKLGSKWISLKPLSFAKDVNLLQDIRDFTKAMDKTKTNHGQDQFIEINTMTHRKLMFWIQEQNLQAMAIKFVKNDDSMAKAIREHRSRCFYYSSLKRLSFFYASNAQRATKTEWTSNYLKQQAEFLAKKNNETTEQIKNEMKSIVEAHPATKTRL